MTLDWQPWTGGECPVAGEGRKANPDCPDCGGFGEYFGHSDDCHNDDCALALGIDDCNGQVFECHCVQSDRIVSPSRKEMGA